MARFVAIGKVSGWDGLEKFTTDLKSTEKWRIDARTTITTVYALADGRVIAECHTPEKAEFEAWLSKVGFAVESLTQMKHIAKAGDVWKC